MIRNVIFDFGQVLIRFDGLLITEQTIPDKKEAARVAEVFFDRQYWDKIDTGELTGDTLIEQAKTRLPEPYHGCLSEIFYTWIYRVPYIEGMEAVVSDLKKKGFRLFLLSNAGHYLAAHHDHFSILEGFEACLFSAPLGLLKPERKIYEHICQAYGLCPAETLFVDDNAANIAGARAFGLNTYLFDGDASKLSQFLEEFLQK